MWIRGFVVFFLCFYSFGDFLILSSKRIKREDAPSNKTNILLQNYHNCTCVFYYQCDNDNFIITSGNGLINERLGEKKAKRILCVGGDFEGEYVCCKNKSGEEDKPAVTTVKPGPAALMNRACGKPLPNINVRIFADEDELTPVIGEFPWLVAIFNKPEDSHQWKFRATGSLIHPRVVLTANHKVVSLESYNLKVITNGKIELGKIGDNPLQERNVKEIVRHKNYSPAMLFNDVSLLILEEPYNISHTPSINTICLTPDIPYENKRCLVAGWGQTPDRERTQVLKKVEIPILPHSKCEQLLSKALRKSDYRFHESLMCAGGEKGKDACKGDGGSPLICSTETGNTMYQVGIVAWGIKCGQKDVPGVYVNVGFLHNWIVDQLRQRNIEIQNYQ